MNPFRRRLASGALALAVLQFALLFAAPVSACCRSGSLDHEAIRSDRAEVECCPPGSHPPGQCPLHPPSRHATSGASARQAERNRETSRAAACRMLCDAPHGPQFVLGMIGVIAAPASTHVVLTADPLHAPSFLIPSARPSLPDAPPPRLL
jgi:hypothetical protein